MSGGQSAYGTPGGRSPGTLQRDNLMVHGLEERRDQKLPPPERTKNETSAAAMEPELALVCVRPANVGTDTFVCRCVEPGCRDGPAIRGVQVNRSPMMWPSKGFEPAANKPIIHDFRDGNSSPGGKQSGAGHPGHQIPAFLGIRLTVPAIPGRHNRDARRYQQGPHRPRSEPAASLILHASY